MGQINEYVNDFNAILQAFSTVYLMADEQDIEAFIERWGGIDLETCFQVLKEGQGEDRLIAIFLLGIYPEARAYDYLLSLLQSSRPLERWASALIFGQKKDEEAFQILTEMLTEHLRVDESQLATLGVHSDLYTFWRPQVIHILDEWQRPELAPVFRNAFHLLWQTTEDTSHSGDAFRFELQCQSLDWLAYALGQLHAFGALIGLPLTEYGRKVALFHMACGHISSLTRYRGGILPYHVLNTLEANPLFREELENTLLRYFGLPKEEHTQIIDDLYMNSIHRFDE